VNGAAQAAASRIAFTSFPADHPQPPPPTFGTSEVYVVNADGSEKRLLREAGRTEAKVSSGRPTARRSPLARITGLSFINADGSGRRNVTREWGSTACLSGRRTVAGSRS
jgi:hypothetical protein